MAMQPIPARGPAAPCGRDELLFLAGATLLGAILRLFRLDSGLWLDEVVSLVTYFRLPAGEIVTSYESANQHLLYSLLAHGSRALFGESAWSVRLPSALLGIFSIPALYLLAREVTALREARFAAVLLAVSYHHIWFSQSARGYSGMVFCVIVGTLLLVQACRESDWRLWAAYACVMGIGILFLHNTVFVVAGHLAAMLLTVRGYARPVLTAAAGAMAIGAAGHLGVADKIVHFWLTEERTGLGGGVSTLSQFALVWKLGLQAGFLLPGALLGALLGGWGWFSYWKSNRTIAAIAVLPAFFAAGAVLLLRYGAYPRAFLFVLPFALLVMVRGAGEAGKRLHRHAASCLIGAMIAASVASLVLLYKFPKQDYSGALAWTRNRAGQHDAICGAGMAGAVYQIYYAPEMRVARTPEDLHRIEQTASSVWVLHSFPRDMRLRFAELYDYLEKNYELVSRHPGTLNDGEIYVLRRGRPADPGN